jgi:DNA-binding MarR family transcriptional regulator
MNTNDLSESVLNPLRRIVRAIDLQSRQLVRRHGLTGPQNMLLRELAQTGAVTVGRLAERISLSQATVTDILNRLEQRGLVLRMRSTDDKRCVQVSLTRAAEQLLQAAPPVLQEQFLDRFHALEPWEQHQIVAVLQRVAGMMDIRNVEPKSVARIRMNLPEPACAE